MVVIDGAPFIDDVDQLVRRAVWSTLPIGHEDLFMSLLWGWWDQQAVAMLQRRRPRMDVGDVYVALNELRDQFTRDRLPTLVQLRDVDVEEAVNLHKDMQFVHQLRWIAWPSQNLEKAVVDYYRAYTQTQRWVDEDLIGLDELGRFEDDLRDEWEREFEFMVEDVDEKADEDAKQKAGREFLRKVLDLTQVTVRAQYNEVFFARGKRHELADRGLMGWHPEFRDRLASLLLGPPEHV
jgi:hypothetical protein